MDFLQLGGKTILVFGVANRKSVAWHTGQVLQQVGANVVYVVRNEERRQVGGQVAARRRNPSSATSSIRSRSTGCATKCGAATRTVHGLLHSIAFADYAEGIKPFHETSKAQFLRAVDISCFSLIALCHAFRELLARDASVVTISISTTPMANENYGFMAPVKAALDSSLAFLAKSFSHFSRDPFQRRRARLAQDLRLGRHPRLRGRLSLRRTSDSAQERRADRRGRATAVFLLSPRSSGINAQRIVVDAGMAINYFDSEIVRRVMECPTVKPPTDKP